MKNDRLLNKYSKKFTIIYEHKILQKFAFDEFPRVCDRNIAIRRVVELNFNILFIALLFYNN